MPGNNFKAVPHKRPTQGRSAWTPTQLDTWPGHMAQPAGLASQSAQPHGRLSPASPTPLPVQPDLPDNENSQANQMTLAKANPNSQPFGTTGQGTPQRARQVRQTGQASHASQARQQSSPARTATQASKTTQARQAGRTGSPARWPAQPGQPHVLAKTPKGQTATQQ